MEGFEESNHLKGEGLSPIIELIPKGNGQINLPKWQGLLPRHNDVKRRSGWVEACPVDTYLIERLGIHDVEAAASIHQYFSEPLRADDRVNHEQISSWVRGAIRMVSPIKGYGGL